MIPATLAPLADVALGVAAREAACGRDVPAADGLSHQGQQTRRVNTIYHVPGGRWYDHTKINPAKGERWFCTEEEARASGWRAPRR